MIKLKTIVLSALVAILAGLLLGRCMADAAEPDPAQQARQSRLIRVYIDTRHCMLEGSMAMLRNGERDVRRIMAFTIGACGAPLRQRVLADGAMTAEEAERLLVLLAAQSLRAAADDAAPLFL